MTLTVSSFKGIRLPTIQHYIEQLNNAVGTNIPTTGNWQRVTCNLRNYLNHHEYNSNVIDQESIDDYIYYRSGDNLHINELFDNTLGRIFDNETRYNIHANEVFDEMFTDNTDDNNLFNLMREFKEHIKVNKDDKKDRFDQFKDFIIKQNRLQHEQSPEFINSIKKQRQELKEYWAEQR